MRKHNGMRPQDIPILLKIIALNDTAWQLSSLSHDLSISLSEVSESLNRSMLAGLIDHSKKNVGRLSLMEFLEHGMSYVFPQEPGPLVRGIPTAHSHPFIATKLVESSLHYVWPDPTGQVLGQRIEPFYLKQTEAAKKDAALYKLLALTDVVRVGRAREKMIAIEELKNLIINGHTH